MKINILNSIIELENTKAELEEAVSEINKIINSSGLVLSHMDIDGTLIYNDYYECLLNNLDIIKKVCIYLKSKEELVLETLRTTKDYVQEILINADFLVDKLYEEVNSDFWSIFEQYIKGLQSVLKVLELIRINKTNIKNSDIFLGIEERLTNAVKNLNISIENGDRTYMCDIILYEIKVEIKNIYEEIHKCL